MLCAAFPLCTCGKAGLNGQCASSSWMSLWHSGSRGCRGKGAGRTRCTGALQGLLSGDLQPVAEVQANTHASRNSCFSQSVTFSKQKPLALQLPVLGGRHLLMSSQAGGSS